MQLDVLFAQIQSFIVLKGINFIIALVILFIGFKLANYLTKFVDKSLSKRNFDQTLRSFLHSILEVTLKILVIIVAADKIDVETTSFVAIIGAAGLAVGLALQGSLSNFAGGVLIILFKPFKLGDYIEGEGHAGTVSKIHIFHTELITLDNKKIIIPNGNLSNSSVINYSANETRRVDLTFGVGYEDNIGKVKKNLMDLANENNLVLKDPQPQVLLGELADSSVNFYLRVWCKTEDYWTVYFELMESVKIRFDEEGINIPYPQMDVLIKK